MLTPLARLTTILARTPGIPDSTPLTMGGEVELEVTMGDLRWLVEGCSASVARLGAKPPPEGFQLVPVEPTEAMAVAGSNSLRDDQHDPKLGADWAEDCYRAMIAAAPDAPAADDGALAPHRATEAEISSLQANLARAREIMKPFAEVAKYAKGSPDACWCGQAPAVIRYRDLTAASRFLTEGEGT